MTQESMEKLYADGFRPAVVLESSPGNFQCVLTIPKLQSEHDRDVGNRLTERLNRQYGDKKLSGCRRIQVVSATPPVLDKKARCGNTLALYPPQMRELCTTRTLPRKNAITFSVV